MEILIATNKDFETVKYIIHTTIKEIYPQYYPKGVVEFFLSYHSSQNIKKALLNNEIFLLSDEKTIIGTGSINNNEICRVFILPTQQKKGYASALMTTLENLIFKSYDEIFLDSSLPAYNLYLNRGYKPISFHKVLTKNQHYLCYNTMKLEKIKSR